jgi:UDP-glucose 4-epimerase
MSKRILVTGAAGFIGSHLVDHLIADGQAVTVLDDFSTGSRENLEQAVSAGDIRIVDGSVLDRSAVAEAAGGCDRVFHLAVQCVRRSLDKPLENHDINATGTLNVLEAARRERADRFVYCSSSEVYGNASADLLDERTVVCEPMTVYGAAKLAGEHYARAYHRTYGLNTVVVRPFNSYGPREHDQGDLAEVIPRFVIRVLNGLPPVIFGAGDNGRDFTYVTDTARGLALAAGKDALVGATLNIACGHMLTIKEVAETVTRLCQRQDLKPVHIDPRPGDVYRLQADTRLAGKLLGYSAAIDFEQGMNKYLAWFNGKYPDPSILLEDDPINWRMPDAG